MSWCQRLRFFWLIVDKSGLELIVASTSASANRDDCSSKLNEALPMTFLRCVSTDLTSLSQFSHTFNFTYLPLETLILCLQNPVSFSLRQLLRCQLSWSFFL